MAINLNIHLSYTMRKFWLGLLISTSVGLLYYAYLYFSFKGVAPSMNSDLRYPLVSIIAANIVSLCIYFVDRKSDKWLPWRSYMAGRLIFGFIMDSVLAFTIVLLTSWLFLSYINKSGNFKDLWIQHDDTALKLAILIVVGVIVYNIIYLALFSYNQYAVVQIKNAKSERKQLQLQFDALKSQLSPHYLFNSLNTISSLIFKDPNLAEDFIRRLAETYQYILSNNQKKYVSLNEEVEFVKSYYYLLKVRFENNLQIEINLPQNIMHSKMPPLTLQMLVENAVKHNIITNDQPLSIYIHAIDNTDIRVTNTKTATPSDVSSFQVGLENIKKRYRYFTPKKIKVDDSKKFTVQLPVIQEIARSA